jgi:peptidyl-prolyl cis-trans isomerase A (cyclophilin A)
MPIRKTNLLLRDSLIKATSILAIVGISHAMASEVIQVRMTTNLGEIKIQLDMEKAPLTSKNFLKHVDAGHYDSLIFHRVIEDFAIQSGGYDKDLVERESEGALYNEAGNGLHNVAGSIAMARENEIDSAGRQFFINTDDNTSLDHSEKSCSREDEKKYLKAIDRGLNKPVTCATYGYAVFGRVVDGMDVVSAIAASPTEDKDDFYDIPISSIIIKSIERVKFPVGTEQL